MTLQVDILTLNTDHRGRVVSVVVSGAGPTASPGLRDTFRTKVSSDWRRLGHVTEIIISHWPGPTAASTSSTSPSTSRSA